MIKYRLDKRIVRWTENWMKCWAQRALISSLKPTGMSVTIGLPWQSVLGSILFNNFIYDLGDRAEGKFVDDTKP